MRRYLQTSVLLLAVMVAGRAWALSVPTVGDDFDNEIWIGCADHGSGDRAYACTDGTWIQIANSCTLADDFIISGEGGDDLMWMLGSTNYMGYGCVGTWSALTLNGHYVYYAGQSGVDDLRGRSGNNDVRLAGDGGDDTLLITSSSSNSWAAGGTGNDIVVGYSASVSADALYGDNFGGSGNDCVEDRGSGWEVFDCGDGSDHYDVNGWNGGAYPGGSCGTAVASCF